MAYFDAPYRPADLTVNSSHSLVANMQAWFPLTQGSGSVAQCILHPSHTGTLGSGVTWETSERGTSVFSDGSNLTGGINTGNPSSVQITGDLTIAAWVKCNDSTPSSNQYIVSKYNASAGQRAYAIALLTSGSVRFTYQSSGSSYSGQQDVESSATLTAGTWHFVVGTFQASTAGKIYIDGELDTSNTSSVPSSIFNSSADLYISGIDGASGPSNCFEGNIQNVKVWSRALSATEVKTLHARPWTASNYDTEALWLSPPASPTLSTASESTSIMADIEGWWVMTDGSGTTLTDISGNGRDATLNGTSTWETDTLGTVNRFDNDTTRGNNANTADVQLDLSTYTACFWVKHEELYSGTNNWGGGIRLTNGSTSSLSSDLEIYANSHANTGQYHQIVHNRNNGGSYATHQFTGTASEKQADNNSWVFWAVTYDGTNVRQYKNGSLNGTSVTLGAPISTTGKKIGINQVRNTRGLTCSMQNVRLYSRCLSSGEISTLYERPWIGATYNETAPLYPPVPSSLTPLDSSSINTDLQGWWALTETDNFASGAADISGNGNNGTQSGGVLSEFGELGTVASFDGVDDRIDSNSITMPTAYPFTLSAWIKTTASTGGSFLTAASFVGATSGNQFAILGVDKNTSRARWTIRAGSDALAIGGPAVNDGKPHFIAGVSVSANDHRIYLDGVLVGTSTTSLGTNTYGVFSVGCVPRSTAIQFFDGEIGNVRYWSRALSSTEVADIFYSPWSGSSAYPPTGGGTPSYFVAAQFNRLGIGPRFRRL